MKKIIWCAGIFMMLAGTASAQTKAKKKTTKAKTTTTQAATTSQQSTSANEAKMPAIPRSGQGWMNTPAVNNNLQISDPVIRTLNQRANGANTPIDFREFMGVGRGTYGVANGQILLRPNGATTSGGITGSGAVGTGSTPGGVGVHGTALGVNGKNPYAGPGMWGTTGTGIGTNFRMTESSSKPIQLKKEE
jgi:hypothetical protein